MTDAKRYHPLTMLLELWKLVRNSAFFVIHLFVIKAGSDAAYVHYGGIIFFMTVGATLIFIVVKWLTRTYQVEQTSFHLNKGLFTKSIQTIPFSKIQDITSHETLFHRIFNVTSLRLETGMSGNQAAIIFKVISKQEAARIEDYLKGCPYQNLSVSSIEASFPKEPERTIHFRPEKRDHYRAALSSLSFCILVPLIISLYFKITEIFHIKETAADYLAIILNSWWILMIVIIVIAAVSFLYGIFITFLKYGRYEISSDDHAIYITKGWIEVTSFSIVKEKVQAVSIRQSPIKRLLGQAQVKLISAGNDDLDEDIWKTNSLYPFLPVHLAYKMISEILPDYNVTDKMTCLPKKSLWIRMVKPSWFWIISTALLFYFKLNVFGLNSAWWLISISLFIFIYITRLLDFCHTRYVLNENIIQLKTGGWTTSLMAAKRAKIIEVKVSQNLLQKHLGVASILTAHHAKPVKFTGINDVPIQKADNFFHWYLGRKNEIKMIKGGWPTK